MGMAASFALLRDGGQVLIRPLKPDDRPELERFFARLSPESRAMRFHSGGVRIDAALLDLASAGHVLVAELSGRLVGHALYVPLRDPTSAEVAIAVDDAEQGRGIGTVLLERLSNDARRQGITRLRALILAANYSMLTMLAGLGFRTTRTSSQGVVEVEFEVRPNRTYQTRADARMHTAAVASLAPLFRPRTVAVIGASRRPGTIGQAVFRNLLAGGFSGTVYPVNPQAASVAGVRAYPSVAAIPEAIDLAVIVVPAAVVQAAAGECLDAGVRALVVISAGFAEVGEEGRRRQAELLDLCRERGARLVGPNCLGVLVSDEHGSMNATFAPTLPPAGAVSISSQSGALGIAILEHAKRLGLGIASFISVGNKADLSSNDLIEYWEDDAATAVIVLYLESFGNPRRFARIARRVSARKPIVAVKGGRSGAGQRAAASHTAALAGSEVAVDALFAQAGVTRCDTLEELFDVTTLFANQPLPAGNRVGVMTNAGGLGILCADACEANGLVLPVLAAETQAKLRTLLPAEAGTSNPVDMLASGSAESYGEVLRVLIADPTIDAAIVLFIPPLVTEAGAVAQALVAACAPPPAKPVVACFVGAQGTPEVLRGATVIPSYTFPEAAARAVGHAAARTAWLRRPAGEIPNYEDIDRQAARAVVAAALAREERPWLTAEEVRQVMKAYGIRTPEGRIVRSAVDTAAACRELGAPVAVKLLSKSVLHKSDVGGVHLGIGSPEAAAAAYEAISAALKQHGLYEAMDGALVQPMLTEGVECLVGVVNDPIFGPLIAFGSGGVTAEVMGDVRFRLHPLTDVDADELIASVKVATLLRGFRGSPPADVPALRDLLLRVSRLVDDIPEITEMDLNPVMAGPASSGTVVVDARLRMERPA